MANPNIGIACQITTGKLDSNHAVKGGEYPFFTCASIPDSIDSYAFDDDVVLVAGNNAQGNFHVSRYCGKFNAYQRTYILTANKGYDIDYIYYAMKLELKRLKERSQGSQTKFLTKPILTGIVLQNLKYDDQKKISSVLSAIDKKIAINNRINAQLEAMAKTLYDYWFVQFDFPDENGKPYKSSGGKMEYNHILKREIPLNWSVIKLSDVLENVSVSIRVDQIKESDPYTPIDSLPMKKTSFGDYEPSSEAKTSLIGYKKNDILIGAMRVYFHRVCIAPFDGITRTTTMILRSKNEENMPYLHQVCNEDRLIAYAKKISGGTQQPYVNWDNALSEYRFAYPTNVSLITQYSNKVRPIIDGIILREKENRELKLLRDWLLPMLMNGQVKVLAKGETKTEAA